MKTVLTAIVLCAFGISCFGIPVIRSAGKDRSKPFPCMARACGCMTADACWRSCCCHTNQQKLAWARENGVTPPDYVVVAAAKEKTSPIAKSCCSSKGSCCDANSSSATKSLPGTKIEREETTSTLVIVSVQDYQKCRGLASLWMTISHAINTSPLIAPPAKPVAGEWISSAMIDLDSISYEPAAPPPKSLAL